MGERYDALVTLGDGAFPFVAAAEGKGETARAIVRTGSGETPRASGSILELSGSVLTAGPLAPHPRAQKRVLSVKTVSVRLYLVGRRILQTKTYFFLIFFLFLS